MIKIFNEVEKKQKNFWNGCVFHPTDAIEDPWGKRILDQIAVDKACHTVRIYTMFEDIVYFDGEDNLRFDFRVSDLRLDYLIEKGFNLLLAYGGMPDCIARDCSSKTTAAKNKTRYKGKMWNTSPPKTPALWEEVCYQYTKHLVERYGEERLSKWYAHCFNESDISLFFMGELPWEAIEERTAEYYEMYKAFVRGVRRVTEKLPIGGPALANREDFFESFLNRVKKDGTELNFISLHYYGTGPEELNKGEKEFGVSNLLQQHRSKMAVVEKCGFGDTPIIIDEWGAASHGFYNREECPHLMFRETEKYPAYYVRLIHDVVYSDLKLEELMICLSGQHEMTEDFSGFRNFFTLNFIRKPIYNAFVLAARLGENLMKAEQSNAHVALLPTKRDDGSYAVMLSYAADNFADDFVSDKETVEFEEDISGKTVTVWCIDKEHTNPYRVYEKMGVGTPSAEQLQILREEGKLKPIYIERGARAIELKMTANATYLITLE